MREKARYRCGTCASESLQIVAQPDTWQISCMNGHPLVPVPGTQIEVDDGRVHRILETLSPGQICTYDDGSGAPGRPCPVCGHTSLVHPNVLNESITECMLCRLEAVIREHGQHRT